MTTYISGSAAYDPDEELRLRLAELQVVIDLHAIDAASGRCNECGVLGPCRPRHDVLYLFEVLSEGRSMPRRAAGATNPEHIGARRVHLD